MEVSKHTEQELLEIAMVLHNMKEKIEASPSTETEPKITFIILKADYRNSDNEYYTALKPKLDYIDYEEGNEVDGMNVDLREIEANALKEIRKQGIFTGEVVTTTRKVPDKVGFGEMEDEAVSYKMGVDISKFVDLYKQVSEQVDTQLTTTAELSFIRISVPSVKVEGGEYELNPMRSIGNAFEIISYCLEKHPEIEVTLDTLKGALNLSGVSNITASLKNSHFDPNVGLLRDFVASSPQAIVVRKSILMPKSHFKALVEASNKS